jgi:hypothetical protein
MFTLPGPSRAGHPRSARPSDLRQLLRHRPGKSGDLPRLRAPAPGQSPHDRRAALPDLPRTSRADLLDLRRHDRVRHIAYHRPTVVPGLPTPIGDLLGLRGPYVDRGRHPDPPTLRRLRTAHSVAGLSDLQRPRPSQTGAVRPMPDQPAPRRDHGTGHGGPRPWAARAAARHCYRPTFHHRPPLAHERARGLGPVRPCGRTHAADP